MRLRPTDRASRSAARCGNRPLRVHDRARRALRSSQRATGAEGGIQRAGVPSSVGLHTLRHSAASVMLSAGVPLKVVSEVFGHASVAITGDIYGHVSPEVSREALIRLSDALS